MALPSNSVAVLAQSGSQPQQGAQTKPQAPAQTGAQAGQGTAAPKSQQQPAPMQLQTLDQTTKADPFPPVNQRFFTANSPTVDTVNAFIKAQWGFDPNRIWRVEAIQNTAAPGVSRVIVFATDRTPNARMQTTVFYVMPDGKHAIADMSGVLPFGEKPFADSRKKLQDGADGAYRGAASKDLMLVEFADLQCPHCKDAQTTMDQLVKDFPNARVVFQPFPIADLHPFAMKAAAYGHCVAKQKNDSHDLMGLDSPGNDAFGEVPRVVLQCLERFRFQRLHIAVIHRGRLRKDLFLGHRGEQARLRNSANPFFAQLRTILPQVGHQFA